VFVCILPGKAVLEMTYIVSGGTLNLLTHDGQLKIFGRVEIRRLWMLKISIWLLFFFKIVFIPKFCIVRYKFLD